MHVQALGGVDAWLERSHERQRDIPYEILPSVVRWTSKLTPVTHTSESDAETVSENLIGFARVPLQC
jgi:hypothetical protein